MELKFKRKAWVKKPQVLNVTRENLDDSPKLRYSVSWEEPGRGEGEVDSHAVRLEKKRKQWLEMAQLQDWGAMAEAGDDLFSYLSLQQNKKRRFQWRSWKRVEYDKINLKKNKHSAGTRVSILNVLPLLGHCPVRLLSREPCDSFLFFTSFISSLIHHFISEVFLDHHFKK